MKLSWCIRLLAAAAMLLGLAGLPGEAARLAAPPPGQDWRAPFAQMAHQQRFAWALAPLIDIPLAPEAARPVLVRHALLANERRLHDFPTDGMAWLAQAWLLMQSGQPVVEALPALALSYRLAPHELGLMMERVLYGLALWPVLPEPVRQAVLVEVWLMVEPYRSTNILIRLADVAAMLGPLAVELVAAEAHRRSAHSGLYFDQLVEVRRGR